MAVKQIKPTAPAKQAKPVSPPKQPRKPKAPPPPKKQQGRKGLYSPEIVDKLIEVIAAGGSDKDAYLVVGIAHETFYNWLEKHDDFREKVTRARAANKVAHIQNIKTASATDWRASGWWLERRWPEEFAQQLIVKVSAEDAKLLKQHGLTPAEAWLALMQSLAEQEVKV